MFAAIRAGDGQKQATGEEIKCNRGLSQIVYIPAQPTYMYGISDGPQYQVNSAVTVPYGVTYSFSSHHIPHAQICSYLSTVKHYGV